MLATLNDVMKIAEEKKIAIGSFNTPNLESLQAVIGAAEELDLPLSSSSLSVMSHGFHLKQLDR